MYVCSVQGLCLAWEHGGDIGRSYHLAGSWVAVGWKREQAIAPLWWRLPGWEAHLLEGPRQEAGSAGRPGRAGMLQGDRAPLSVQEGGGASGEELFMQSHGTEGELVLENVPTYQVRRGCLCP